MISKINKGEKFVCVRDVVMDDIGTTAYKKGKLYTSDVNGYITNEQGNQLHRWYDEVNYFFIPYTYAAISAHYAKLKNMDEADPFAMLLLDLEPTLERSEACSCGEHNPNGIYGEVTKEFGFVTPEQMKEVDKKINWRDSNMFAETLQNTPTPDISKDDADFIKLFEDCCKPIASAPLPAYYDNANGSLYKIAEQRGWNFYQADAVKRIDRCMKKGNFKQDIEKTIALLQLWVKEVGE